MAVIQKVRFFVFVAVFVSQMHAVQGASRLANILKTDRSPESVPPLLEAGAGNQNILIQREHFNCIIKSNVDIAMLHAHMTSC